MILIIASLFAGILTVAAPCILPLLPVVIGGSLSSTAGVSKRAAFTIAASLAISIIFFTLILKTTTVLLGISTTVWQSISGLIIILFGLQLLFPSLWEQVSASFKLQGISGSWLSRSSISKGWWRDVLLGAALGPVFNSCSPTYALLVAAILPVSFGQGLAALSAYALGLSGTLLAISLLGQRVLLPLKLASNPEGWFRRGLGIVLILTGLMIIFGLDKQLQAYILNQGWYDSIGGIEKVFLNRLKS